MMNTRNSIAGLLFSAAAMIGGFAVVMMPAPTFAQDDEGGSGRRVSQTLTPTVAKDLGAIYELMTAEQYRQALTLADQLIAKRGGSMKAFDKATTYEIRGSIKANLEDFRGALRDFQVALDTGALPPARNNQLRYFIAQLNFQLEDFPAAIRGLNKWIADAKAAGETVDANAYYLLAAAYVQTDNFRAARSPAEQAVAARPEPKKTDFDLLNLVYSELNQAAPRLNLLERMINIWPQERGYWTQLSGLYSTTNKDSDAFAVLEVAYRAGLLTKEAEVLTLVQYYSFFDNPYRGAKLLEREMDAGLVKRNQKNLTLLSQLWSQSREHKRAIPVLRAAAQNASNGKLYYRLGQVLLADEQYKGAETALTSAVNKGGMSSKETGDSWLLMGTARFSQAGPEDRAQLRRARAAFVNARRYDAARRQANDWITYIDAIISTQIAGIKLENQQKQEATRDDIKRIKTQIQVCRLQGCSEEEIARLQTTVTEQEVALKALEDQLKAMNGDDGAAETENSAPEAEATTETDNAESDDAAEAEEAETTTE